MTADESLLCPPDYPALVAATFGLLRQRFGQAASNRLATGAGNGRVWRGAVLVNGRIEKERTRALLDLSGGRVGGRGSSPPGYNIHMFMHLCQR